MRSSYMASGDPGYSTAGFKMSPASPPVQQTSTLCTPSAAYLAVVPAPFDASSSGWAWTWSRVSRSAVTRGTLPAAFERKDLHGTDTAHLLHALRVPVQAARGLGRELVPQLRGDEHLS